MKFSDALLVFYYSIQKTCNRKDFYLQLRKLNFWDLPKSFCMLKLNFLNLSLIIGDFVNPTLILWYYSHINSPTLFSDKSKPCVSHRDLNTRNILVKADLSCSLCDLGLAIKLSGSHYYTLGEEQHAETKSISDVSSIFH